MSLFQKIFGGSNNSNQSYSKNDSKSQNKAFSFVRQKIAPAGAGNYVGGLREMGEILGNDFETYKQNTGYDFIQDLGMKNIMGQFGGGGMVQSGAAAKALQKYGLDLQQTFADRYMAGQQARSNMGLAGIGQLVGSGAQTRSRSRSNGYGSGTSTPGIGGFIGSLLGG